MNITDYKINDKTYQLIEFGNTKNLKGEDYNFTFNLSNGFMARWGKTFDEDPLYSPVGPEILDIEVTKHGCKNKCPFCYKDNNDGPAVNMSLETFKKIVSTFPKTLTQIAFGITSIHANPELFDMFAWCRKNNIVPNVTISGKDLTEETAERLSKYLGAIAVSVYPETKDEAYNAILMMSELMKQVNIHLVLAKETLPFVHTVMSDVKNDPRLRKVNAVVFLSLKPKGRATGKYNSVDKKDVIHLIETCMEKGIIYGFDSCGATKFQNAIDEMHLSSDVRKVFETCCEPCESSLFSFYVNVYGQATYCSFMEGCQEITPVSMLNVQDFIKDIWYHQDVISFRNRVLANKRTCPIYDV